MIYTAASIPMAALEVIARQGAIAVTYEVVEITIPDDLAIEAINNNELPELAESVAYGTAWAKLRRTAVLRVLAAVIRGEYNYILNPLHPDFPRIRFRVFGPSPIDPRPRKKENDRSNQLAVTPRSIRSMTSPLRRWSRCGCCGPRSSSTSRS